MSRKEAKKVYVMEQVVSGTLTVKQAAQILSLSERHGEIKNPGHKDRGNQREENIAQV